MNRRWDKWGATLLIGAGLLTEIERQEAGRENMLRILDYHRVGRFDLSGCRSDPSLYSVDPEMFATQMEYLAGAYHVIALDELLDAISRDRALPPRSVMLTFDDGYHDFLENAWPVLRCLRLPAILFAVTDYLYDSQRLFWWDRLYQSIYRTTCPELNVAGLGCWPLTTVEQRGRAFAYIKRYIKRQAHQQAMQLVEQVVNALGVSLEPEGGGMLNWDEVRQMSTEGLCVAAHTVSHPILSRMSLAEARYEIVTSHQVIEEELGQAWPVFAYPVGHPADLQPGLVKVLREEGFQVAMTMIEGHNVLGRTDPLQLRRVGMAPHLSMPEFRLVLTGAYNWYGTLSHFALADA
jgi:peptidoglycan/xylan/chitin deacetylase (PgdA/CDA1 family)